VWTAGRGCQRLYLTINASALPRAVQPWLYLATGTPRSPSAFMLLLLGAVSCDIPSCPSSPPPLPRGRRMHHSASLNVAPLSVGLTPGNLVGSLNMLCPSCARCDRCPFLLTYSFVFDRRALFPLRRTCLSLSPTCSFVTLDLETLRTIFRVNSYLFWVRHLAGCPELECSREDNSG
jgi:hypothetical protein